jgi:hypothetical protein
MSGTDESLEKARAAQAEKREKNRTSVALTGHARTRKKKIQKQFLKDFYDFWTEEWIDPKSEPDKDVDAKPPTNGQMLIRLAASTSPADIVKMAATMVPKEVAQKSTTAAKKNEKKSILEAMRGMEQDARSKAEAIDVEAGSGTVRQGSPESKAIGILAGESPLRGKR